MNILIGCSAPPDGGLGISTYSREIAAEFSRRGHTVHYASPPPKDFKWLRTCGIEFFATPFDGQVEKMVTELASYIKAHSINAIINNDNAMVQNIAPLTSAVFFAVGHLDSTAIAALLSHNIEWVDYFVAISSDMQLRLLKRLKITPDRCPHIHNGIADPLEGPLLTPARKGPLRIVFGGGLIKRKGGDQIRALIRRATQVEDIEFHIFGPTPRGIPSDLSSLKQVTFHGSVPHQDFLTALLRSHVFLMPSRAEGCPMALLEAISLGLVPIVSDGVGAMRWIVTNGHDGFVCGLDDWPKQALACLRFLLNNREHMDTMQIAARRTYEESFQIGVTADHFERFFFNPILSREQPQTSTSAICWHRRPHSNLIERINYRLGRLVFHSVVRV